LIFSWADLKIWSLVISAIISILCCFKVQFCSEGLYSIACVHNFIHQLTQHFVGSV